MNTTTNPKKVEVHTMKQLTNYQRVSNYLVKVFKAINETYFNDSLEMPTITIQSTAGAFGHITTSKVWNQNGTPSYELNISADYLNRPIENVVATLIHEASHLYCLMNGIKDTSGSSHSYHNKKFKLVAEEMGHLTIEHDKKYGWTITSPSEDTLDFCISYGFEDILINRESAISFGGFSGGKSSDGDNGMIKPRKPATNRRWFCPCCGMEFSAPVNFNGLCIDCNTMFIPKPDMRGRKNK